MYTKKQVNEALERVMQIHEGKVEDRYTGLKLSECFTEIEKTYFAVIISDDFDCKPKKAQMNEVYKRLGIPVGETKEFEKTVAGVIIRNLPADKKYHLTASGSFAEGEGWCCENCGRFIRHWNAVRPKDETKEYLIGSECIQTVVKYDGTEEWHARQLLTEAARLQRFFTNMRKLLREGGRMEEHGEYYYFYAHDVVYSRGWCTIEQWNTFNRSGIKKADI